MSANVTLAASSKASITGTTAAAVMVAVAIVAQCGARGRECP